MRLLGLSLKTSGFPIDRSSATIAPSALSALYSADDVIAADVGLAMDKIPCFIVCSSQTCRIVATYILTLRSRSSRISSSMWFRSRRLFSNNSLSVSSRPLHTNHTSTRRPARVSTSYSCIHVYASRHVHSIWTELNWSEFAIWSSSLRTPVSSVQFSSVHVMWTRF